MNDEVTAQELDGFHFLSISRRSVDYDLSDARQNIQVILRKRR